MKTRDAVANLSMDLCRDADRYKRSAECAALKALTTDPACENAARTEKATADGLMIAVRKLDELRIRIESGEVS